MVEMSGGPLDVSLGGSKKEKMLGGPWTVGSVTLTCIVVGTGSGTDTAQLTVIISIVAMVFSSVVGPWTKEVVVDELGVSVS